MPTLEPIVVNPPKEKKTYTYSENDIIDIVAQAIKQGKIEAGAAFEEVRVRLSGSDCTYQNNKLYVTNETKKAKIREVIDKVLNNKITFGNCIFSEPQEDIKSVNSLVDYSCCNDGNDYSCFSIRSFNAFANKEFVAGVVLQQNDDILLFVYGFADLASFMQTFLTDPSFYVELVYRVEK